MGTGALKERNAASDMKDISFSPFETHKKKMKEKNESEPTFADDGVGIPSLGGEKTTTRTQAGSRLDTHVQVQVPQPHAPPTPPRAPSLLGDSGRGARWK